MKPKPPNKESVKLPTELTPRRKRPKFNRRAAASFNERVEPRRDQMNP
jgi:hypothetical protein